MHENEIQRSIRLALGARRDVVLWRNSTGAAMTPDGSTHRFGLCKGSSDLIGIIAPSGRFLAIEVKSEKGRTTPEQDMFLELVRRMGGVAGVARSVEDALAIVNQAQPNASNST